MNLIWDVKTTFRLQRFHCINFCLKHIKNESRKWYLDDKEQKAMFLIVSRTCILVLSTRFFLRARKIGRLEIKFSTSGIEDRVKQLWTTVELYCKNNEGLKAAKNLKIWTLALKKIHIISFMFFFSSDEKINTLTQSAILES